MDLIKNLKKVNKIILLLILSLIINGCFSNNNKLEIQLISNKDISSLYPEETFNITIQSNEEIALKYQMAKIQTELN